MKGYFSIFSCTPVTVLFQLTSMLTWTCRPWPFDFIYLCKYYGTIFKSFFWNLYIRQAGWEFKKCLLKLHKLMLSLLHVFPFIIKWKDSNDWYHSDSGKILFWRTQPCLNGGNFFKINGVPTHYASDPIWVGVNKYLKAPLEGAKRGCHEWLPKGV